MLQLDSRIYYRASPIHDHYRERLGRFTSVQFSAADNPLRDTDGHVGALLSCRIEHGLSKTSGPPVLGVLGSGRALSRATPTHPERIAQGTACQRGHAVRGHALDGDSASAAVEGSGVRTGDANCSPNSGPAVAGSPTFTTSIGVSACGSVEVHPILGWYDRTRLIR